QGFNANNGRNHPELNWQVAETGHFKIIFPERLSGIENEVAPIAEESYDALSSNLNVDFEDKIRIYLSDEDEINNGFAVPIDRGYTNIWVNTNDYSEIWTGNEKWLRKVVAHELGHIFHFNAVWTNLGIWNFAVGSPFTRAWTEGLAQYQTEQWDSQRGDRYLRKAIFDSRPDFNDGSSAENGRLMYASGNSELRYFTEKYGDSTLVNLLSHREPFLKFWEKHDFYNAFDEIVDGGYDAFKENWRKHMNVYYNTLASQMERTDSLDTDAFSLPGQVYYDMAVSPDEETIALLSLTSLARPVRRLYKVANDSTRKSEILTEGAINFDLSWSDDGETIFYSRKVRGDNSSIVNDIHSVHVETGRENRLTHSRRARFPVEGFEEGTLAYIVNEGGTGNLFLMDVESGRETRITNYTGDVQLLWLKKVPSQNSWLVQRFDADGNRNLVLIDRESGEETVLGNGRIDNRKPVLSPDESSVAYTSLRDEVPNVFRYDFETGDERRITNLFTGGEVYGWITENDSLQTEKLLVSASETKRRDNAWWVDADRTPYYIEPDVPDSYASWRKKSPPVEISSVIEPDESLVQDRYGYNSLANITHAASIALPYYSGDDYGIFATSNWVEPLGKHTIAGLGWLSLENPGEKSYGSLTYLNNQLYPFLGVSVYKLPESARFYGDRFLLEEVSGGEITARWPLDILEAPYQSGNIFARFRHVLVRPYERDRFDGSFAVPAPQKGRQTDLRLGWQVKKQRPWRDNMIHPLDGSGLSMSLTGSQKVLGSDVEFLTADINSYTILHPIGMHRIYLHGRFQAQLGDPLPQDFIGFSRYDNINLNLPGEVPFVLFNEAERVRGYRDFVAGKQVAFGSLEYRMPFLPSLETRILGLIEFGSTALALFTDAGAVWEARFADGTTGTETRWGAGGEVKNRISLFGVDFTHSLGIAQPARELFTEVDYDLYYRVRAVVPF
ncbi:MAG: BamA/TamA family outer membrane protein, partial [Desulfatiglandaceae bacterium]